MCIALLPIRETSPNVHYEEKQKFSNNNIHVDNGTEAFLSKHFSCFCYQTHLTPCRPGIFSEWWFLGVSYTQWWTARCSPRSCLWTHNFQHPSRGTLQVWYHHLRTSRNEIVEEVRMWCWQHWYIMLYKVFFVDGILVVFISANTWIWICLTKILSD